MENVINIKNHLLLLFSFILFSIEVGIKNISYSSFVHTHPNGSEGERRECVCFLRQLISFTIIQIGWGNSKPFRCNAFINSTNNISTVFFFSIPFCHCICHLLWRFSAFENFFSIIFPCKQRERSAQNVYITFSRCWCFSCCCCML